MDIIDLRVPLREIIEDYRDSGAKGVVAYGGKLDVRPPYQREFVYNENQQIAVVDTVMKGFPLNSVYWVDKEAGEYEVLDGQQRTLSLCQYVDNQFSVAGHFYDSLPIEDKERFLAYEMLVHVCKGDENDKLNWFERINIAGAVLTKQELRNAVYAGRWLADAKGYFSRKGCPAERIGKGYVKGAVVRQEYLQTAIEWASEGNIEDYMSAHRHDKDAVPLWNHFEKVVEWVREVFPNHAKAMEVVKWGGLYATYKDNHYDPIVLAGSVSDLMKDEDVGKKSGIYPFLLGGWQDEKLLSIRAFSDRDKQTVYARQEGLCAIRQKPYPINEMEADHITPWSKGGRTDIENCQMIHKDENRAKGAK